MTFGRNIQNTPEYSLYVSVEYLSQMSSKSTLIILSYTLSKLVHFLMHSLLLQFLQNYNNCYCYCYCCISLCRYNEGLVDIVASSVQMLGEPRPVFPTRTLSLSSPVLWVHLNILYIQLFDYNYCYTMKMAATGFEHRTLFLSPFLRYRLKNANFSFGVQALDVSFGSLW